MLHDSRDPQAYMDSLEEDWRKHLISFVADWIKDNVQDATPFMQYKMLAFGDAVQTDEETDSIFCINAQRNYVSLYVGNIQRVDPDGTITAPFDCGKSCVRIKKSKRDETDHIKRLLSAAVNDWRQRKNSV